MDIKARVAGAGCSGFGKAGREIMHLRPEAGTNQHCVERKRIKDTAAGTPSMLGHEAMALPFPETVFVIVQYYLFRHVMKSR